MSRQRLREGIAAAQAKQFDRARALLQPIAEASPNEVLPWFWLAIASPTADAAIPCLRRVLALDGSHVPAREALAKLLVTQARATARAGDCEKAVALAREATELTPGIDTAWLALADISDTRPGRAEALRRAYAVNPAPGTKTRLRQALLYDAMMARSRNHDEARVLFKEVAALKPDDLRVWCALARLAKTQAEALEAAREIVRHAPNHGPALSFLKQSLFADARALDLAGNSEHACSRWRELVALGDSSVDAWLGLAQSTDDEDEAQRAVEKAFALDPKDDRVAAIMARRRTDPAAFLPPPDAFAHLEQAADSADTLDATSDALDQFDLSGDLFERFWPAESGVAAPAPMSPPPMAPAAARIEEAAPADVFEFDPPAAMARRATAPAADSAPMAVVEMSVLIPFPAPRKPEPEPEVNGTRRIVMVVDDSPTIRKILGLTLERAGYKVVAEPDGESAVERLTKLVPDVILLDIAMPKLDGYEVCKRIKADPRTTHVPVIMLSGKDALFDKVKGRLAGASEYLTKPFETSVVLAAVAAACLAPAEVGRG